MRIGIDISSIPYGTGVSRYTANLVRALIPHLVQDQLILFGSSFRQKQAISSYIQNLNSKIQSHLYPFPPSLTSFLFNSLHLPISWFTGSLDVFHAWDWQVPSAKPGLLISTVHDLSLFKYPGTADPEIQHHHQQTLKILKTQAAAIIAVSQTTKDDLMTLFGIPGDQIYVIPEGLPSETEILVTPAGLAEVKQKYNLTKPYFLLVGTQEKRKNLPLQIEAWRHFRHNFDLVLVGKPGGEVIKPEPGMIMTGYVTDLELAALYRGASVLLYASLYEGFGLPILEAFYHRLPVVTANLSGMAEVAGEAAVCVDPLRVEMIIMAIGKALEMHESLVQKGLERLNQFSWDRVAQEHLALYRQTYDRTK
jgi:glycosyltransferase involved in cell wall biosynthesis